MRALVRRFAIATLVGVAACGDSAPPVPPTAPTQQPQPSSLVRTTLTPDDVSFTGTGQSTRLTVMAIFSDGTTRDVTPDVNWEIDEPDVVSIAGGVLSGRAYGSTAFRGAYLRQVVGPGAAHVRVPAGLLVPLTGVVRDQHGRPVPGVQVLATGAVDMGATTDAGGGFDLGTTYGPVRLTLTRFGYETTERTLQVAAAPLHALLVLPESPSPYTEHVFEAAGSSNWQTHRIDTRSGGALDVMVESPACDPRSVVGVVTVRLRSGGAQLGDAVFGCRVRVRQLMPADEGHLEVSVSTPATYRVTYRVPR